MTDVVKALQIQTLIFLSAVQQKSRGLANLAIHDDLHELLSTLGLVKLYRAVCRQAHNFLMSRRAFAQVHVTVEFVFAVCLHSYLVPNAGTA